jgi:hypothetical protein
MMITRERTEGHYDVQEVEFGKVYRWRPERVVLECDCGEVLSLTNSMTSCNRCSADHAAVVREELAAAERSEDEALHPWRYDGDPEDASLPF